MKIPNGWRRLRIGTQVLGGDRVFALHRWRRIGTPGRAYKPIRSGEVVVRKKVGAT